MRETKNPYQRITDRILGMLEAGTVPWRKPWKTAGYLEPRNMRGTGYRGINWVMLGMSGYDCPCWLTFKQARDAGGHVRKGEKGFPVVFWKMVEREDPETGETREQWFARVYTVFNLEQTDDVPEPKWLAEITADSPEKTEPEKSVEAAEKIATRYLEHGGPSLSYGGPRAIYRPASDSVNLPPRENFETLGGLYATLFHELGHSTGHESRLNRKDLQDMKRFGDHAYSREELTAELTAAFLMAEAGLDDERALENTAAYLKGWQSALGKDASLIVQAAQRAQKAADLILGRKAKGKAA